MINWNEFVTREHLNLDSYNEKFRFCDDYLSGKISWNEVGKRLHDMTIFSYLFFTNDKGQRLKLYPYQDMILNDNHKHIYFRAANQIGKSYTFNVKGGCNLIYDHGYGHNEGIISKSLLLSTYQMMRVKTLLKNMRHLDYKEFKGERDSMSVITVNIHDYKSKTYTKYGDFNKVKYTNMLVCAPCTEGALSYPFHELNLDEYEFWEMTDKAKDQKWFYEQIAEPRTYDTQTQYDELIKNYKGRIFIMSNPNGSSNYATELENLFYKDNTRKYHVYVFNIYDKPGITEELVEKMKEGKDRSIVESTLLAIRSISDRNYFTADEIERSYDPKLRQIDMVGKQPFFFLDIGAKSDASVLTGGYVEYPDGDDELPHIYIPIIHRYPIGYPLTRVVGVEVDESDGWHYEKSVKEYIQEWSAEGIIPTFGYDITGNQGMKPLFEVAGIDGIDVTFSGPIKSGMYQRLKYFMEKGLMHRIKHKQFDYEFSHLEMKKSVRGYLMIHHASETDRDDVCDSCAGLVHLIDPFEQITPSLTMW